MCDTLLVLALYLFDPIVISHEGYLEILITAIGVIVAVAALAAAVLGFMGYQSVKQGAIASAKDEAAKQAAATAKHEVERLLRDELHSLADSAIENAFRKRNENVQGADLGQSEAEDVLPRAHSMDNLVIRPVKRIIDDEEIGGDSNV